MKSFEINTEIFLTAYKRQAMPSFFLITQCSDKAMKIQNNEGKSMWIPKSVVKWDDEFKSFYVADWFRKKLENWQISILQA